MESLDLNTLKSFVHSLVQEEQDKILQKLRKLESELNACKQKLASTPQRIAWSKSFGCPFFEMIDDDYSYCHSANEIFEGWCSAESIQVVDGKLYCKHLQRYVKKDCYITNPEHIMILNRINEIDEEIRRTRSDLHSIIPEREKVEEFLAKYGFVNVQSDDARYYDLYSYRSLLRRESILSNASCGIDAYFDENDQLIVVTFSYTVIDMDVLLLFARRDVCNIPPSEVTYAICELRRAKNIYVELYEKRTVFLTALDVDSMKKAIGNELFEEECRRLFNKSSVEVIQLIEEMKKEMRRRWEEREREKEEEKMKAVKDLGVKVKDAFKELQGYVTVDVDMKTRKVIVKTKKYMDKETFNKYLSIAKSLKMRFNPSEKTWELSA